LLGANQVCAQLGGITLERHQQSAVIRIEAALEEFGGALLSDDVGMGKTFVATAIARRYSHTLVIAPAALASMWSRALATTKTAADFLTIERLSRGAGAGLRRNFDLVIVDEAHHARNRATRRHRSLAELARTARIVLLTATPIHNRRSEMVALLSLFLGSRAKRLTAKELARCVVRRDRNALADEVAIPLISPVSQRQVPDDPDVVRELMDLPPPLPARGGGESGALVGRGLVHQWASSQAALREAVRRRIAKAAALTASLESGNYPTARELETWVYGDGALQLGFPELLSSPASADAQALLESVRQHATALEKFHAAHRPDRVLDAERARILREIRRSHPKAKIVAFSQYAETVSMLFGHLAGIGRVAALSARGGLVAGGKLPRDEVLSRFAPHASGVEPPPRAEQIDLLLTTDLLSEGVNLQDAQVVVHLDIPWTAARMEQRVGRVARMGSWNEVVHVYLLRPPASAADVINGESIVRRKWRDATRAVGSSMGVPFPMHVDAETEGSDLESIPGKTERLRRLLESWRGEKPVSQSADTATASVRASTGGFIGAVTVNDSPLLVARFGERVSADVDAQIAACASSEGEEVETRTEDYEAALDQIHRWFEHDLASELAGVARSRARGRRELIHRIDSAIQNAPPHLRASRSHLAARARIVATKHHAAALESDLGLLAHSRLPDHEWLEAVGALDSIDTVKQVAHQTGTLKIHAVLLMRDSV